MRLFRSGKSDLSRDVSRIVNFDVYETRQRTSGRSEEVAAPTAELISIRRVGFRAIYLVASACLAASCNIPGRQVDESGLGKPTPLQREIARLYAGGGGTRLINEWFSETCPQDDLQAIVQCAVASGFNCDDRVEPDSDRALCAYEGTARVRSTTFAILPSIDGRPSSDWYDYNIKVLLYSNEAKSKYGRLIYFSNSVEVN